MQGENISDRISFSKRPSITHWHKTNPSRSASVKSLRSRSSPDALSPLDDNPFTFTLLELAWTPLFPHILSNLASERMRTSTPSQSFLPLSV